VKEEFVIKVLSRASEVIAMDQVKHLRTIIEDELYNYELTTITRALVPYVGIPEKLLLYLASKKLDGLAKSSLESYRWHLIRFIQFVKKDVEEIDAMDIRRYLAAYAKTGVKNSTIQTEIWTLKSFFGWLETEDYILKSPMRKIQSIKTEKRVRKALTPEELELLRDACETHRERAMVEFFYSTGCRLDEVVKLDRNDLDWNTNSCMVIGKGDKERKVFLNAKAKVYIWKYFNSRKDDNEALFVSERRPHGRLGRRSYEKDFSKLGKKAGLKKKVFPHLLRHTTATTLVNNGANLAEVQHILGHSNPSTTQIYIDVNTDSLQQAHKKHVI
jgi:integrase/recombinase XerD